MKIPMIATTIMMKILMKYNFIEEIVKWGPNYTQHHVQTPILVTWINFSSSMDE